MEDFSIRAIVIGVSLFVTMLTLTAILLYYNTARQVADAVSRREDIASSYERIMNKEVFEDDISGVDVRSLINKYAGVEYVEINIIKIGNTTIEDNDNYKNINNSWLINIDKNDESVAIISEKGLDIINPSWKNHVEKIESEGKIIINISLNV